MATPQIDASGFQSANGENLCNSQQLCIKDKITSKSIRFFPLRLPFDQYGLVSKNVRSKHSQHTGTQVLLIGTRPVAQVTMKQEYIYKDQRHRRSPSNNAQQNKTPRMQKQRYIQGTKIRQGFATTTRNKQKQGAAQCGDQAPSGQASSYLG